MTEVVRSVYYDQSEILRGILQLHCPDGFDCDVTYGNGSFYKAVPLPRLRFDIDPQTAGVEQACSTKLPVANNTLKNIVFDPPFLTYVKTAREHPSVMAKRFGGYWAYGELEDHYKGTIAEAYRVLLPEGVLVFKCQDIIHNHKMHCTHAKVIQWAEEIGFRVLDLYVLPAKNRMPMPTKNATQKHARIFHSYFLVFQRNKIVLDSTKQQQYNNHTITGGTQMSKCSICSETQFMSVLGPNCKNGHVNAPAQERVALEGTVTQDNAMVARLNIGEDLSAENSAAVAAPAVEAQVPVDKLVKIYVKIRDALGAAKKDFEKVEAEYKEKMAMVATELKARAQLEGVDGFKTEFGTVYLSETMKTSCADWSAFGEFLKTHDPLEFMEKRISSTAVKEYMKHNEGQLPPGVSVFKELEARVRRAGEK